jgi:dipeptidyl aminopeptidase/acylaminoacyl peptidase
MILLNGKLLARLCARALLAFPILLASVGPLGAQEGYQKPPKEVCDILAGPRTPEVLVSPARDRLLMVESERYPLIADLAQPMLRLAGLRINPRTNGPHRPPRVVGLSLMNFADQKESPLTLPAGGNCSTPVWSPDGKRLAITSTKADGIRLCYYTTFDEPVRICTSFRLNDAFGEAFHWMPDGKTLLCRTVPADRGPPPTRPAVPRGPTIQESAARRSPVRTFQDLLQNAFDEDLFEYYATAQLVLLDTETGTTVPLGKPALFAQATPAPDGKHLLVVRNHRPFSYLLPGTAFPREVEVWDRAGNVVHKVAGLPLADQVPIEGVPTGPRQVTWRPTEPATLVWVEALDDGNPKKKVPHRDRVLMLAAPFRDQPVELVKTVHRFAGLTWGEAGLALVREFDRQRRWERTTLHNADKAALPLRVVWDRSVQDRYQDPGKLVMRTSGKGQRVLRQHEDHVYLVGQGASPAGDRPFLDQLDLKTLKSKRLFQSGATSYETVVTLLSDDGARFLTRYESRTEPPNYFLYAGHGAVKQALTRFADPAHALRGVRKQLVTYRRADGVDLSFTLYLPPDYKEGQRLPAVLWAYPREFVDAGTAGQVAGSPHRFTTLSGPSHLFFLTQGYAILDGATMPVIGDPETANNTYIEQIVSSARAAIDKADAMGVIDRQRVGVGGHSYGAFMTANLLAHSNLFRAGIARSGAYNRTLTPFGFQSERRTLWESPDVYLKMSPFMVAHQIKGALLLIHGEADNNSGTFPIQSERMYQAVKGNGGTVRYVTLPYEAHGYLARESVEHTLYEMIAWFDRYVKHAPALPAAAGAN